MPESDHCRTCFTLIDKSLDKAKKLSEKIRNVNATIAEILLICTGIVVQESLIEKCLICAPCRQSLVGYFKFRQKACDVDTKFKEIEEKASVIPVAIKSEALVVSENQEDETWDMETRDEEWLKVDVLEDEPIIFMKEEETIKPIGIGADDQRFKEVRKGTAGRKAKKRTLEYDPNPITNRRRRAREPERQENLKKYQRNSEGFFECPKENCPGIFKNIGHLEMHLENKHPNTDQTTFPCEQCKEVFPVYTHLKRHIMNAHMPRPYECNFCGKCYAFREGLRGHIRIHMQEFNPKEKVEVACNVCSKIFCSEGNMLRHRKEVHFPKELLDKPFVCDICGSRWPNKARWKAHLKTHSKTDEFRCDICNKGFNIKGSLTLHIQVVHSSERKYFCDQCGKTYKTKYNLRDHQLTHSDIKLHKCSMCPAAFKLSSTLHTHEKHVHANDGPVACDLCGKLCKNAGSMKNHRALHNETDIACPYCEKTYKIRNVMERHVQRVHQGIKKRHECSICLKNLWSRKHIADHIEEVHKDVLETTGKKADELVRKYWTTDPSGANNGELPPRGIKGRPVKQEQD